ncbi:hypothetical protein [Nakamurella lactea]|nr:hypothetical protein [Nakamurella lactea]
MAGTQRPSLGELLQQTLAAHGPIAEDALATLLIARDSTSARSRRDH